jgi:allantoate deiminase
MNLRQDALAAVSEMIIAIESSAKQHEVVATVGQISNRPNGVNVISGLTKFSLDIRSETDERRETALNGILQQLETIATRRNVRIERLETHAANAVHCDLGLQALLRQAIATQDIEPYTLFSGAGHDAMAMAEICPIAMLFLRCEKGISHHPAESIQMQDVATALAVLSHTLQHLE